MKMKVCDVCYYGKKTITQALYRISYKGGNCKRIAIDVCEEHKAFFKVTKCYDEAEKKVNLLFEQGVIKND
jgi:hypothetical protein